MNCKPGDLVVVVRGMYAGEFCTCIRLIGHYQPMSFVPGHGFTQHGGPVWEVSGAVFTAASDLALTPIRDPGDDARDQTLDWLPVPSTEKEAA